MTAEEWRPVAGFPDYRVSSQGQVVSLKGNRPRLLIGGASGLLGEYRCVTLCGPSGQRNALVHRLVAAAFIGPCPDGMEVRHLDGDPTNNTPGNLAYGTHSENMRDRVRHGTDPNASKTRCKDGHPFDEANTRIESGGRRRCLTCYRAYHRAYRTRRAFRAAGIAA